MIINIEKTVSNAFHHKHPVDCRVFYEKNQYGMSAAKFDRFVQSKGLSSIDGQWKEISYAEARSIFIDLCSRSLCYGTEVMPTSKADFLASQFFKYFNKQESKYFTNFILDSYPSMINIYKLHNYASCHSLLPTSLLSIGILSVNTEEIGLFVRGEWD